MVTSYRRKPSVRRPGRLDASMIVRGRKRAPIVVFTDRLALPWRQRGPASAAAPTTDLAVALHSFVAGFAFVLASIW